jgi:hypothetical protein
LSFSRIFGDLLRQTLLFFNYFFTVFLHNSKQNRGYDTATSGVEREERARFFKDTPHFGSLPQGERRDERVSPSPLPSPAGGEGRREMKRFKQCPSPYLLPRGGEG